MGGGGVGCEGWGDGVEGGEVGLEGWGIEDGGGRWEVGVGWMQPLSRLGSRQGPQLWGESALPIAPGSFPEEPGKWGGAFSSGLCVRFHARWHPHVMPGHSGHKATRSLW